MARYPLWRNAVRDAFNEADGKGTAAFDVALKRKINLPFKRESKRGHKCPYAFNAKTMHDVVDYLLSDRKSYGAKFFAWNVKVCAANFDHPKGEYTINPVLDKAWEHYFSNHPHVDEQAFDNARRQIVDDEWTSYPGDDQGDWEFSFEGRSGGWLVLRRWKGLPMNDWEYLCEFIGDKLASGDWATIVKFYCGIVTADHDFTSAKAAENVEFYLNDLRHEWEETRTGDDLVRELHDVIHKAAAEKLGDYGYDVNLVLSPARLGGAVAKLANDMASMAKEQI